MRTGNRLFKVVIAFAVLVLMPALASAQGSSVNTFSPYSMYGIGDISTQGNSALRAMGGIGTGFRSPTSINTLNPASYSAIGRQTALFQIGLEGQNYYLKSSDTKSSYNSFNIRDIGIQFPITKGLGFSLHITPFSKVGYRINSVDEDPGIGESIGYIRNTYIGTGGVNQYKAGLGYRINDRISIGAEAVFYQGNISRNFTQTILPITGTGSYIGMASDNQEHIAKFFANFGIQADVISDKTKTLTIGATYQMGGRLDSKISEIIVQSPAITGSNPGILEIVRNETYRSDFKMPHIFSAGFYYGRQKFGFGADYSFGNWSANTPLSGSTNIEYKNTHTIKAGLQYTPNANDVRRILNRWTYRLGARYEDYYMRINGQNISEKAVTLGIGIPIRGYNNLDLGVELGTRGKTDNGMIRENFFKISVGLNFFGDDYWFRQYKYD